MTPQAARLLGTVFPNVNSDAIVLPPHIREWLAQYSGREGGMALAGIPFGGPDSGTKLELSVISQIGADEILLRLIDGDPHDDQMALRTKLGLTQREAEVLLWIARGKSNRDVAEILTLSPRTVNKHLEQIFTKLGVENRTSAAALAARTLGER